MFSKFIKKDDPSSAAAPAIDAEPAWENRLQAALGDDAALLALAKDAPAIDIKLSAVQALSGEDALRAAEREFRKHDRRIHSAAKQRYETLVRQRETRARAAELILSAQALVEEAMIPANRLVELNQSWDALDAVLLEDAQKAAFAGFREKLAELMRERGERKRSVSRWSAVAQQALAQMNAACAGLATAAVTPQELAASLAAASDAVGAALAANPVATSSPRPEADAMAALAEALQAALQSTEPIKARLALLDELQEVVPSPKDGIDGGESAAPGATPLQRWRALPPIADPRIGQALNARFEAWLHGQDEARKKIQTQQRQRASETRGAQQQARIQTLTEMANAAEAALAAGHPDAAGKHVAELQLALAKGGAGAALHTRIGALQAEFARLKDWQKWGGGRVRDELVEEAEALAASTVTPEGARPPKLPIKQLDQNIEQLRARWKELDRLGGATSKSLWQRFDGALKTASLPVTAHLARLNEARQENLAARKNLLAALDALSITGVAPGTAPDWKEIARALAHFQTEWRKLGPLEHTVPHKARTALLERMKAAVARLETPLREVRSGAQAEREQLIVRARALSQDAQGRETLAKVRELQAQWQAHAKSQPLPRKTENLLWADFRAAIDALMGLREAAFSARDAGLKANQATREALLTRLDQLHPDTPPAEIKQVLAAVETEWRKAGEAPRNQADKLETRFRAARAKALEYVAGSAQRIWQGTCDALSAKLALCGEAEALPASATSDIQARWAALATLPPSWEQALQARLKSAVAAGGDQPATGGEALDQLLLKLESALDLPTPAAFQADRRTLKLLAMKQAMEGRRAAIDPPVDIEKLTATAFACARINADQDQRLAAILAALRRAGAGSLRGKTAAAR